jgi:hypothetical protein
MCALRRSDRVARADAGPALDIPQLAFNSPLQAGAAGAGELAVEAFDAGPVNRVSLATLEVMAATVSPEEEVTAARLAFPGERTALRCGPPTGHHRGVPSGEVGLVTATKIFAKIFANGHPQTTLSG